MDVIASDSPSQFFDLAVYLFRKNASQQRDEQNTIHGGDWDLGESTWPTVVAF
jgi:hypothetical protein